jgi:hypothetical protein
MSDETVDTQLNIKRKDLVPQLMPLHGKQCFMEIKNIPSTTTKNHLLEIIPNPLDVIRLDLLQDTEKTIIVIITFSSKKAAEKALVSFPGAKLVEESVKEMRASLNLLIKYIPLEVSLSEIVETFSKYGDIVDYSMFQRDDDMWSAMITYSRFEDASDAMQGTNGIIVGGSELNVGFYYAKKTEPLISGDSKVRQRRRSSSIASSSSLSDYEVLL